MEDPLLAATPQCQLFVETGKYLVLPPSQDISPSPQIAGTGVWQTGGQTEPAGIQWLPREQPWLLPLSHQTSPAAQTAGAGIWQTCGQTEPAGMQVLPWLHPGNMKQLSI